MKFSNWDGKSFEVFTTTKGTKYIVGTSKAGKKYPIWIFQVTEYTFENRKVYVTKKGKYCIYKPSSNGYPYAVWLERQ